MKFDLTDSQREIRQKAREIATNQIAPKAAFWDQTEEYPWENAKILADAGFMGMNVPKEFGGPERPLIEAVLVVEEMAKVCGITGRIVVDSNMGVVGAIIQYGTEEQKKKVSADGARRGQARHRHHRARGGKRRHRHDDAGRARRR